LGSSLEDERFEKLLLAEYEYMTRCYLGNEELGERRVNLFITLTTAVLTTIAAITGTGIPLLGVAAEPKLFLVGSIVLFLFGMITLMRIIHRNIETDKFLQKLDSIRTYFVGSSDEKLQYLPFNPYGKKKQRRVKKGWKAIFSLGTGGLLQTVALMNSLIVATSVISLSSLVSFDAEKIVQIVLYGLLGLAVFIAGWAGQMIYVRNRYDKEIREKKEDASGD